MSSRNISRRIWVAFTFCAFLIPGLAAAKGLSDSAYEELEAVGLNKYLGKFTPVSSEEIGDGWVKHTFDSAAGEGPVCISGSDYSVYTRKGKHKRRLLVFLQGGGACWQNLYQCTLNADSQAPPFPATGIWDLENKGNPFRHYSVVYMPYCDGSIFAGDNDVLDPAFAATLAGGEEPVIVEPIRRHRGLRNVSAGMDVAKAVFPKPKEIALAGTSAGGVGVTSFAPFLARFVYGNKVKKLTVFNDAGPIVSNPGAVNAALARAADWRFDQYYPASCTACDPLGQALAIVDWRLANDPVIREAFYSTDADETGIAFTSVDLPGNPPLYPWDPANGVFGLSQASYRALFVPEHGKINLKYPERYKRFIVSGDATHTALQFPLFYTQEVDGTLLNDWTRDFLGNKKKRWVDLVEEFVPLAP